MEFPDGNQAARVKAGGFLLRWGGVLVFGIREAERQE